jgi:hypothetical protein
MAHQYERTFDEYIGEIKKIAASSEETARRQEYFDRRQRGEISPNVIWPRNMTAFELGHSLAEIVFACDSTRTLRDWPWHIEQGHVTEENQYERL